MNIIGIRSAKLSSSIKLIKHYKYPEIKNELIVRIFYSKNLREVDVLKNRWSIYRSDFSTRKKMNRLDLYKINRGHYVPQANIIVDEFSYIIQESVQKPSVISTLINHGNKLTYRPSAWEQIPIKHLRYLNCTSQLDENIIFSGSIVQNFYHWLIEAIPRAAIWNAPEHKDKKIILPRLACLKFHQETLNFFGISSDRILLVGEDVTISESLFLSRVAHSNTIFSPITASFFSKYRGITKTMGRKFYISRCNASFRRLLNESEIVNALMSEGFECVTLESLTFEAQVNLFQSADTVVAPHGAGLANAVFMPLGSKMVELIGSSFSAGMTSYSAIAEMFNIKYSLIIGQSTPQNNPVPENWDFEIPVEDIMIALR